MDVSHEENNDKYYLTINHLEIVYKNLIKHIKDLSESINSRIDVLENRLNEIENK